MGTTQFLPTNRKEMRAKGWDHVDVVLVTGDAYVDHPSFGVALIGRWLEAHGYRVAVLAQPRHHLPDDFKEFGRPRLFFGITAGNLDSIVANYSGNAKVRDQDNYSPQGNPYFDQERSRKQRRRPDRAATRYAGLARAAYGDVPVVLGGLEASLRRFVHYDYQQAKLRASALTDAKADLLVFGMGERAVVEIADRLARGKELAGIAGTCERLTDKEMQERTFKTAPLALPSWEDVQKETAKFMEAELAVDNHARSLSKTPVIQRQQALWVVQHPPAAPLTTAELDNLYGLPFARRPHPAAGDVPAFRMIQHSVTIVRGCFGNCSFCAIARHQGPFVTSRSLDSVVEEVRAMAAMEDFRGTISDLGGPTANLYGTSCENPAPCKRHDCLYPKICRRLRQDEKAFLTLLDKVSSLENVKHVHVSSGLRMELLLRTPKLLTRLLTRHTPGALKIAPEHTEDTVLRLMHKANPDLLVQFIKACRKTAAQHSIALHFTPYFIAAHPGCTADHMKALAQRIKELGLAVRQFQDFTPTPGTLSTAMYATGLDRDTLKPIPVARKTGDRRAQRLVLEKHLRPAKKKTARQGKKP